MGLGLGVVLIVVGAVLMWAVDVDINYVDEKTLGLILLVVGVGAVVLALVMNAQRSKTKHVQEHRYDR